MPTFRYQGAQNVHYELYGNEGDPVLTIVNGLSMRTSHWAPYFKLLPAAGVRVLAYDMLGQGQSSKPILGVDFEDHARILKALHDHLGIRQPYVLGISFGGVVVLKYAAMFPDALKGVIPISTFSELDPQLTGHATNLYLGLARVGFEFYLDLLMPLNFSNEWMAQNAELLTVIKRVGASSNELFGIQNLMESLRDFKSMTPELKRIKVPTLILNAEYDALTPRHLHDIIRREVANSRMTIVQHKCHAFTLEIPEITTRLLVDFVRAVEGGSWKGDQSVWVASDQVDSEAVAYPYPVKEHLRFIALPQAKAAEPAAEAAPAPANAAAAQPPKPAKKPRTVPAEAANASATVGAATVAATAVVQPKSAPARRKPAAKPRKTPPKPAGGKSVKS